jgi:hypothetical protein
METIFVMIPAYKDPILRETLESLFNLATHRERIFVALGAQYDDEIPMPSLEGLPEDQIRLVKIHPENRPGTARLRHILNKLYANEDYYVSVDSHTIFEPDWDTKMIQHIETQPEYRTIIMQEAHAQVQENLEQSPSTYFYSQITIDDMTEYSNDKGIIGPRLVLNEFVIKNRDKRNLPIQHYLMAGMFMTRGEFARDVTWGQYWQIEQEEAFLSYQAFMTGWTVRQLDTEVLFRHMPDKYYEAVYGFGEDGKKKQDWKDEHKPQGDWLPHVSPRIWRVYMYNSGPWKVRNAVREPFDWWNAIGLLDDYNLLLSRSGKLS